jgi:phosphoribosyl-AMP cyclohydrolase / phosphoribosyl-ATP pyrophosphohydrolase
MEPSALLAAVKWDDAGLAPVIIVDARTNAVLTLAYANHEALAKTLVTHSTWLYSRSRAELWNKGATSGNTQQVVAVAIDCDSDALQYRVIPAGPACHTGAPTCFTEVVPLAGAEASPNGAHFAEAMLALSSTIADRRVNPPEGSYTAQLFTGGIDRIAKKVGEEATEVVIAAKNEDRSELVWETSDLLYHLLVLLAERRVTLDEIGDELARRAAG